MRQIVRGIGVLAVVVAVALSVEAGPKQNREGEGRRVIDEPMTRIVKVVKRVVRSLGDLLTVPTP